MAYWDSRIRRTSRKELKKLRNEAKAAAAQESKKSMWGGWGKTLGAIALPILGAALAPFTAGTSLALVGTALTSTVGAAALAGAGAYMGAKGGSKAAGESKKLSESDWHQDTRDEVLSELKMAREKREASAGAGALTSAGMTILTAGLGDTLKNIGAKGAGKLGLGKALDKVSTIGGKVGVTKGNSMSDLAAKAPDITFKNMWEGTKDLFRGSESFNRLHMGKLSEARGLGAYKGGFGLSDVKTYDTFSKNIKALGTPSKTGPMGEVYKSGKPMGDFTGYGRKPAFGKSGDIYQSFGVTGSLSKAAKGIAESAEWALPDKWAPRQLSGEEATEQFRATKDAALRKQREEELQKQFAGQEGMLSDTEAMDVYNPDFDLVKDDEGGWGISPKASLGLEDVEPDMAEDMVAYGDDPSGLGSVASSGQQIQIPDTMTMPPQMTTKFEDQMSALGKQYGQEDVSAAQEALAGQYKFKAGGYKVRASDIEDYLSSGQKASPSDMAFELTGVDDGGLNTQRGRQQSNKLIHQYGPSF